MGFSIGCTIAGWVTMVVGVAVIVGAVIVAVVNSNREPTDSF